jgi:ubiquinone/menaquinone biosynthesis C-methylase UbiE
LTTGPSSHFYPYQDLVDHRTTNCFSGITGRLLIAGGGDLPGAHTQIARHFSSICCLDISQKALDISKQILGDREEYVLASILDIPKSSNFFDAVFCAHVIYHIDKQLQSKAIRELVRVIRPGGRAVIIYWNPRSLPESILRLNQNCLSFGIYKIAALLEQKVRPRFIFIPSLWNGGISSGMNVMLTLSHGVS